ncbi:MAG: 3-methyl-2-oxobutanoate hydroxymethyltransferase [Verrucomicrobiota bacterium]|nr:3-methyl-2-oxobutanoate hydroxymethyltransferase [Verrucomicrobiota bacterium]
MQTGVKVTTQTIRQLKGQRPIVCITAYDTIIATLVDRAGVDLILVGDSVGTTQLGFDTTIPVTMDMMAHHTAAVARAKPNALVVADLPFGEARHSTDRLLDCCMRLMQQSGAEAIKIEGGMNIAANVARLVQAGIPILGHIGLLPQRYYAMGGYRKFGKETNEREKILADAKALEDAGVFAIIGEMIQPDLTAQITKAVHVPFIGIGCGTECDGQILVSTDVLGLNLGKYPGFVKKYAELGQAVHQAISAYKDEVIERRFPAQAALPRTTGPVVSQ